MLLHLCWCGKKAMLQAVEGASDTNSYAPEKEPHSMSRRLPPFSAIKAFEAAARLHSFKAASEELCVTQSAISHQIKALEQYLNAGLFYRTTHGLELTSAGSDYFAELAPVLDRLEQLTRKTRDTDQCGPTGIAHYPAWAALCPLRAHAAGSGRKPGRCTCLWGAG